MNKVELVVRLTKDPETKLTANQTQYCNFTLAVDRRFKDANGQRQADFINCVAWRSSAEFVSRYFSKGSMIVIEGKMQNNDYTDQNGTKHYSYEVLCDNVTFGESKKAQDGAAAPQQQYQQQPPQGYPQQYGAAPQQYQQAPPPQQYPPQGYPQQPYNQPPMY